MPNKPDSITALSALELMERLHKRQVSCAEVMQAYLTVMDELNPSHRAIVARVNSEQLLSQAAAHDQQFTKNATHSLLYGFPQAPKDLLPAAGIAFTRGSPVLANNLPEEDAELLARLRPQGAIFVGKTNVPEFGLGRHTYNPLYGITRNAIQPELSAAGSSGGTAVAVATHMLPVADGSDMMGSLRAPAAFNGIYGLRPTPDLIPDSPVTSANRPTLAVNGPMARSIPDLALMLAVMADFPSQLPFIRAPKADHFITPLQRDFAGTTIAWLGNLNDRLPMEDGMRDACLSSLQRLQDA